MSVITRLKCLGVAYALSAEASASHKRHLTKFSTLRDTIQATRVSLSPCRYSYRSSCSTTLCIMHRKGRILDMALKNAGIVHSRSRRKLSFDTMGPTATEDRLMESDRALATEGCRLLITEEQLFKVSERFFDPGTHAADSSTTIAECPNETKELSVEDGKFTLETSNQEQPLPGDISSYSDEPPTYAELQTIPPSTSVEIPDQVDERMSVLPDEAAILTVHADTQNDNNEFNEHPSDAIGMYLNNSELMINCNGSTEIDNAVPSTSNAQPQVISNQKSSSIKRRERRAKLKKKHLDYLSDDEALLFANFGECDTDSDVWVAGSDSDTTDDKDNLPVRKKTKKGQKPEEVGMVGELGVKSKKKNKNTERKKLKNSGLEYTKKNGNVVSAKTMKPNPCQGKRCGNDCGSITEERRRQLFEYYWKLSVERRRDWVVSMSQRNAIKRKRNNESNKRNVTYNYFINDGEGKRPVCLQFLSSTIALSHKTIYYTVSNAAFGIAKEDLRGKCEPPNKTKEATKIMAINFIKSLPAVPSHHCRKDSSRVYLPQEYKNLTNLYQVYKNRYIEQGIDIVSDRIFRNIFTEDFNIAFHVPKKDKCVKCLKFENSTEKNETIEAEKLQHEEEKRSSYDRFKAHQNVHLTDPSSLCVSFDLEKVLNTPHGQSMLLYYSRKLAVYNLCFYESNTRNVYCFYWDEVNGKRGANEIASILNTYIQMIDNRGTVKHLLLYCDCCPGQNRNKTVMAMIHSTLQSCKNLETIQINFLLTGHTYMPVDSVHAVIERNLKNIIVYAPSQWYTIFSTARQNPMPYNVNVVTYKDFMKWDAVTEKYFKGNLTGKISKIRIATFKKKDDSKITLKYSMNDSDDSTTVEVQCKTKIVPTTCYKNLLPISKAKYDDLSKLCKNNVVPAIFHNEFLTIPTATSIKDTLPESDIEDVDN